MDRVSEEPTTLVDSLNLEAWKRTLAEPHSARALAEQAASAALDAGYRSGAAMAQLNLAWSEFYLSRLDAAERAGLQALDLFNETEDIPGLSMAFLCLGSISLERGELDRALEYDMKAVELAQSAGRKDREAAGLNNVGEVLRDSGEIHEALNYFMQAAAALKASDQDAGRAFYAEELEAELFTNIGQAFIDIGETENAVGYLELARGAAEAASDICSEVRALKGLAVAQRRQGKRDAAGAGLQLALGRAEETGQVLARLEILLEIAVLHIEMDRYGEALSALDRAMADAQSHGLLPKLADCYRYRSLAYEASGNFSAALLDFKRFHETMESMSADRVAKSKKDSEIRFELERSRQEAEIYRLRNVELKDHRARLERTNDRLSAVAEIGRVVTASLDIEVVAGTVHESLGRLMDNSGFSLVVHDEGKRELEFALFVEDGRRIAPFSIPVDSEDSFAAYVVRNKLPLRMDDAAAEYGAYIRSDRLIFGRKTLSVIYVPLLVGGRVVGALGVQSAERAAYTDEDVQILSSLGAFVAVALENSRAHTELLRLNGELKSERDALRKLAHKVSLIANHDGLTGLPNRLLLGELLEKALHRAERNKAALAVFFMDLDDFKPINDRFGHHAGDSALIEVARRLKEALRASDVVARVGGDEFVAFAADLDDRDAARVVAEKLIAAFDRPVTVDGVDCRVGISIGIALYPKDGRRVDDLLRSADDAMYRIKRSGKNGLFFFGDETAQLV